MNDNSMAIILLCSHLCVSDEIKPYEPSEWTKTAAMLLEKGYQPSDILSFSDVEFHDILGFNQEEIYRTNKLLSRSGSISFELEKYENIGIEIITRADKKYPAMLKKRLGASTPPLFYYAGNLDLLDTASVGFVGSRSVDENDTAFAIKNVTKINDLGYGIVSGGARGIDTVSSDFSIENGSTAIEYISDSLVKKLRQREKISAIRDKKLLILSVAKPDAGFNTGVAMMRNKFIYAQSTATIVVKSDYKKGGTWSGASDCIKHKYAPVLCWNNSDYKGNLELIKMGAIPIDGSWNGNPRDYTIVNVKPQKEVEFTQMTFFD